MFELFKHIKNNSETGFEKKFICYIEVEHGASWYQKELPLNWPEISFLKRKVNKYNYKQNVFKNECKLNGKDTIYLKTNKYLYLIKKIVFLNINKRYLLRLNHYNIS